MGVEVARMPNALCLFLCTVCSDEQMSDFSKDVNLDSQLLPPLFQELSRYSESSYQGVLPLIHLQSLKRQHTAGFVSPLHASAHGDSYLWALAEFSGLRNLYLPSR